MHTYKIHSTKQAVLRALSNHPKADNYVMHGFRLVLLTKASLSKSELEEVTVVSHSKGNTFRGDSSWATSNVVDELHDEFLRRKKLPSPAEGRKARDKWLSMTRRVKELEKSLEEAKRSEEAAARKLVATFGKTPIEVKGEIYDPGFVREHVYYRKRMK